ncbi:MAG: hypothetical protein AAB074_21640 [Planctomycetota bacterium]
MMRTRPHPFLSCLLAASAIVTPAWADDGDDLEEPAGRRPAAGEEGAPGFAPRDRKENMERGPVQELVYTRSDVKASEEKVAAIPGGFVIREGKAFARYDAAGKNRKVVCEVEGKVADWLVASDGIRFVVSADGRVYSTLLDGGGEVELGKTAGGPLSCSTGGWIAFADEKGGAVSVSPDGKTTRRATVPAGLKVTAAGASADGQRLFALLAPVADAAATAMGAADFAGNADVELKVVHSEAQATLHGLAVVAPKSRLVSRRVPTAGPAAMESVLSIDPDGGKEFTLATAAKLGDPSLAPGGGLVWFAGKGVNGRMKVWRSEAQPSGTVNTARGIVDCHELFSFPDTDCLAPACLWKDPAMLFLEKGADGVAKVVRVTWKPALVK